MNELLEWYEIRINSILRSIPIRLNNISFASRWYILSVLLVSVFVSFAWFVPSSHPFPFHLPHPFLFYVYYFFFVCSKVFELRSSRAFLFDGLQWKVDSGKSKNVWNTLNHWLCAWTMLLDICKLLLIVLSCLVSLFVSTVTLMPFLFNLLHIGFCYSVRSLFSHHFPHHISTE